MIDTPPPPQGAKLTKRPVSAKATDSTNGTNSSKQSKTAASIAAAQKREEQRAKLAEMRRKIKMEQKEQPNGVEIFIAGETS